MSDLKFHRILLKLSGEALQGQHGHGIDPTVLDSLASDIEELVDFLVVNRIPSVFVETSVSDKNVRALVEGAAAR